MNETGTHVIGRLVLESIIPPNRNDAELHNRLRSIFDDSIQPLLETTFSAFDRPDRIICFEKLTLDIKSVSYDNLEKVLPAKIREAVAEKLSHPEKSQSIVISPNETSRQPGQQTGNSDSPEPTEIPVTTRNWKTFLFYLREGVLPWYVERKATGDPVTPGITALFSSGRKSSLYRELALLLQSDPRACRRLALALDPQKADRLCESLTPGVSYSTIRKSMIISGTVDNVIRFQELFSTAGLATAATGFTEPNTTTHETARIIIEQLELNGISQEKIKKLTMMVKKQFSNTTACENVITFGLQYHMTKDISTDRTDFGPASAKEERYTRPLKEMVTADPLPDPDKKLSEQSSTPDESPRTVPGSPHTSAEITQALQKSESDIPLPISKHSSPLDSHGIFIENAGIILLWPFLTHLFMRLGYIEDKRFLDLERQSRAVLVLHFAGTKTQPESEHETALCKILCGMPLDDPLPITTPLMENESGEIDLLLRTVIGQWGALKNTSPDGLRQGFLQREGKLTSGNSFMRLQVERKTIDILLKRLPWPISIIMIPWMKERMQIEWI